MRARSSPAEARLEPAPVRRPIGLCITPEGRLRIQPISDSFEEAEGVGAETAERIEGAFAESDAAGLLYLATREDGAELPPSLTFGRRIATEFLHTLCALPESETTASHIRKIATPPAIIAALIDAMPPIKGGEYFGEEALERTFRLLAHHAADRMETAGLDLGHLLESLGGGWHALGRVWFHLAENRDDARRPFAFLATYTTGLSKGGVPHHAPLGRALEELSGRRDALLRLLAPVQRAAEKSETVRRLVESGEIFHPIAWTAEEAQTFLDSAGALEGTGVMFRLPKAWSGKRPSSPKVEIRLGDATTDLGSTALLSFDVRLALDGEPLTEEERQAILRGSRRLQLLRGRWVEIDPARLRETLEAWRDKPAHVSFAEGLRILAGADERAFGEVVAGTWLEDTLRRLRDPVASPKGPSGGLRAVLRPYQAEGLEWLWLLAELGLGGCLADDMGLGKTVQVIALFLRLVERWNRPGPCLVVLPASVVGNWKSELERFAPGLRVLVAHRSERPEGVKLKEVKKAQIVLTTYATLHRTEALHQASYALVVLDEAQAIKNPSTRQAKAVKALKAKARFALTGTPIENRLGDLWSLFDFLNPGLLGSPAEFERFVGRMKREDAGYGPLRRLVRPYLLRRLKSDRRIIDDLPDKTEVDVFCALSKEQAALYEASVRKLAQMLRSAEGIERRGLVLGFLTRFKQICNHPSHWHGDGEFAVEKSGKFLRLKALAGSIAERQEKVLVFTQYREMTAPLESLLAGCFGREGLVLHGGTGVKARTSMVKAFQSADGPPFFVLSLKAGGVGLNLTGASHVIHFDRWWNPAVENQATDRAYRIGQHKNVLVHRFICRGTLEERIHRLIEEKRNLAEEILRLDGTKALTEMSDGELLDMIRLDRQAALQGEDD